MFIMASLSFASWSIHPGDIPSRQGVDFTLILTAVAFKLVLTEMLPALPYLTVLDIYVRPSCTLSVLSLRLRAAFAAD